MIYNSCGGSIGFAPTESESLSVSELDYLFHLNVWINGIYLLLALVRFNFE